MKTLMLIIALICSSCVPSALKIHNDKLETVKTPTTRSVLFETYPPLKLPVRHLSVGNSSGVRGGESYIIDDVYRINYSVLYAESPSYNDMTSFTNKEIDTIINNTIGNPLNIRTNNADSITNIRITKK